MTSGGIPPEFSVFVRGELRGRLQSSVMLNGCILAIDDDPVSLAITAILLEAEGWTVLQAAGGEEALELLANGSGDPARDNPASGDPASGDPASGEPASGEPASGGAGGDPRRELPGCILTDLRMPGLCGAELAARLRQAAPAARLLAMTATPPPPVEGYDAVLAKPLSIEALRAALAPAADAPAAETPEPIAVHSAINAAVDDATGRAGGAPAGAADEAIDETIDETIFERLCAAMPASSVEEVIAAFLQDSLQRIASMRTADAASLRRQAHTIKGGASMIGAREASRTAAAIEAGVDHPGELSGKLDELEAQCRRAEVILLQRLKP